MNWAVFAGRWQPLHNGHRWVIERILSEHQNLVIAIVNPMPLLPPDPGFDRFWVASNPLTYLERYMLLERLASKYPDKQIKITPAWHPRFEMRGEAYCLPPRRLRTWYVPLSSDEEEKKASDFRRLGERVVELRVIPESVAHISGVAIRQMILKKDRLWKSLVPTELLDVYERIGFEARTLAG